ncbi:MAG: cation:proton antiporter [Chloroflexi bacterium]|nr:cation:proton antiporter [Chloroflexota bacterium]
MGHSGLLDNLVLALGVAFIGSLVAARLGQSVILGYIAAGAVISPFTPGFVGDLSAVEALADIGVIFLMFAIGVELSLPDLLRVGRIALVGGSIQVLATIGLGFGIGLAVGWPPLEALFFGSVLSNSSTIVLGKVLGERGEADSNHGRIGLAWASVQDTSTILLVVILSALASGGGGLVLDLLWSVGKAAAFLALMAILGARIFPPFFERVARLQNRELFIVMVAAVALGMAYVSSFFGLSVALGAFVAGVVVGESDLSHQILAEVVPLRDIFAGLFFVSVGMLIDPAVVVTQWPLLLLTIASIVVVKGAMVTGITRLAGYPIAVSVLTGVTLAQSAEFSFLLARVGANLGVVSSAVFSLMLAGAVASIILSPALHDFVAPSLIRWLERVPFLHLGVDEPPMADPQAEGLRRHTVICGFGRVAEELVDALDRRGFRYLVIEYDPRIVHELRKRGVPAIYGDASNPIVLAQANLDRAAVLAVLMPDIRTVLLTTERARQQHPRLSIVARAFDATQLQRLLRAGATDVVQPEFEAGVEVIRHTLRRYGMSGMEVQSIMAGRRAAFYRRALESERARPVPAPEI